MLIKNMIENKDKYIMFGKHYRNIAISVVKYNLT
jgi:hypothetical protein